MKIVRDNDATGLSRLLTLSVHKTLLLPSEPARSHTVCTRFSLDPESLLGNFVSSLGGLLVDHGWLHLLGSGNRTHSGLIEWNTDSEVSVSGLLLLGFDVLGGAFAWNRSTSLSSRNDVLYFSPQTLNWLPLHLTYEKFLEWILTEDLRSFYRDARWPGWEEECQALGANEGIAVQPPLSQSEPEIAVRARMALAMKDLWKRHRAAAIQPE